MKFMSYLYESAKTGEKKSAEEWLDDMGGIEVVVGRPMFGAPTPELVAEIMFESGLMRLT